MRAPARDHVKRTELVQIWQMGEAYPLGSQANVFAITDPWLPVQLILWGSTELEKKGPESRASGWASQGGKGCAAPLWASERVWSGHHAIISRSRSHSFAGTDMAAEAAAHCDAGIAFCRGGDAA